LVLEEQDADRWNADQQQHADPHHRSLGHSVLVSSATDTTIVGPGLTGVRGGNGNPFDDFLVTAL
jgi:hypothetical protein